MGILTTGTLFIAAALLSIPALLAVALLAAVRRGWGYIRDVSILGRARDTWRARRLERRVRRLLETSNFPTPHEFAQGVCRKLEAERAMLHPALLSAFLDCASKLYEAEGLNSVPLPPPVRTELTVARHRDSLIRQVEKLSDPQTVPALERTLIRAFRSFCEFLPPLALQATHVSAPDNAWTIRLGDSLSDAPGAVEALCGPVLDTGEADILAVARERLERNWHAMSKLPYPRLRQDASKLVPPTDYRGSADEIVHGYLKEAPFEALFDLRLPFGLPDSVRFEHQWVVAGSGHGKTQCLQYMISLDLERVARGEASVIVIDSQGDMINTIAGLKAFAPGEPLHDKLVLIDPTDIEWPVALNLFDAGLRRFEQYGPLERERLLNGTLEVYDFILGSLLSAELTQKQAVVFRFLTRLMLHIPGATIHTFRELMEPDGYRKYQGYIAKLEGTPRAFFETEFNSKQFEDTKRQVLRRLWGVLENRTFERMFSHSTSKLDLFEEMNAGKVILIHTAKDLLKQTGTELFGRFFIALIAQVAQERATLPEAARKPCFCYIDEASEYFDQNISSILETARKQKIGLCCAHQYGAQLSPKLFESFAANTSIKLIGGVSDKDARSFAHMLRSSPEFILDQPKGSFAMYSRNLTKQAVSIEIPFGRLENLPRMSETEWAAVRGRMRDAYSTRAHLVPESGVDAARHSEPEQDVAAAAW